MNEAHWIASLYWNPSREAFVIPFLNHPVAWYGVLFVTGFILAYFILNPILSRFLIRTHRLSSLDIVDWPHLLETMRTSSSPLISLFLAECDLATRNKLKQGPKEPLTTTLQQGILNGLNRLLQHETISRNDLQQAFGTALASPKQTAYYLTDRLSWFVVAGTLIGARLGAVFFYDWPLFRSHPEEIFKVWHGGLASHGGFAGVILSLYLYWRYIHRWIPQLTFLHLLDYVAVPTTLVCCFIRMGNFMNQEILGTPTTAPWGIIFGSPAVRAPSTPLHPVQLYEAGLYLLTFCILWQVWKHQSPGQRPGALIGGAFILGFGGRFILEFWKATQESVFSLSALQPGQILSLPFILAGILLIWHSTRKTIETPSQLKN